MEGFRQIGGLVESARLPSYPQKLWISQKGVCPSALYGDYLPHTGRLESLLMTPKSLPDLSLPMPVAGLQGRSVFLRHW